MEKDTIVLDIFHQIEDKKQLQYNITSLNFTNLNITNIFYSILFLNIYSKRPLIFCS